MEDNRCDSCEGKIEENRVGDNLCEDCSIPVCLICREQIPGMERDDSGQSKCKKCKEEEIDGMYKM